MPRILGLVSCIAIAGAACAVDDPAAAHHALVSPTATVDVLAWSPAPSSLTSDRNSLYWIDDADQTLVRMAKGGGSVAVLARGVQGRTPWCIAVDAQHVYWLDIDDGAVRRLPLAGGAVETLATGEGDLYAIALDRSYVYWSSNGAGGGRVRRRSRWGGLPVTLASGSFFSTLVVDAWFVYAADAHVLAGANQIIRVPRSGGAKVVMSADEDALGLAGAGNDLYWKRFWTGDVRRASKWLPGATTITDAGGGWGDLDVDAAYVWWSTGPILHRVARSGGPGAIVAELPAWANSIALDGGAAYLALDATDVDGEHVLGAIVRVRP